MENAGEERSGATKAPVERRYKYEPTDLWLATWMSTTFRASLADDETPNIESWANELRLLREDENASPALVEDVLSYCQHDQHWRKTLGSPSGLRRMWHEIYPRYKARRNNGY